MIRPRRVLPALCALAALSLAVPHTSAQLPSSAIPSSATPSGSTLSGLVTDAAGAALVGATLTLTSSGHSLHTVSDATGRFTVSGLPSGPCDVLVRHEGFADQLRHLSLPSGPFPSVVVVSLPVASLLTSVVVEGRPSLIPDSPVAQTVTTISREDFRNTPSTTVADILDLVPGVSLVQGNGPRDVAISIRGSNDRQTYGVRNIQVFEDGFPVTQPDGLARTDLADPHAYSSVDVVQGPSSAQYGNYATGGAIDFHTRPGSDLQGFELGVDTGSFGYSNAFLSAGTGSDRYDIAGFVSNVHASGFTANNQYNTVTVNLLGTVPLPPRAGEPPRDRLSLKFLHNELSTNLSLRLSLTQFRQNPYQQLCTSFTALAASNGCASVSLYTNGFNGTRVSLTAAQAGLGRHDRRTITGARWEHDLTSSTAWQTQFVWDNRDIDQPTSNVSFRGTYPSFNLLSGLTRRGPVLGHTGTSSIAGYFNRERINSTSYNLTPAGNAALGGLLQTVTGAHRNAGLRVHQDLSFGERWTLAAGLGLEFTHLNALAGNLTYPVAAAPALSPVAVDRSFVNAAPEVALQFRPTPGLRLHTRLGTGFGTPQATQLFTNAAGQFGNNTTLETQRNLGIELGADWQLGSLLQATLTGFNEWFRNEQVTQSAGVNLQSFTFNAPASRHTGVEAAFDWQPLPALPGLRLRSSWLFQNQRYTRYTEQLTTGTLTARFIRDGNRLPGVQPNVLNVRVLYDQPSGRLRGFGAFLEENWRDASPLDNANLLAAPAYALLNLSTHYDPPAGHRLLSRLRFVFDLQNLTGRTWVSSASNLTDSLSPSGQQNPAPVLANFTGSIYAGSPRSTTGGVRLRF